LIVFYFSGTGNSRFVAERFATLAGAECHSIELTVSADEKILSQDTIGFCYPVYGSCVARPMREFVRAHSAALSGKRFVIFCTQLIFSGDGAHALCAELPGGEANVVYAEHFRMPNNVCNFPLFRIKNGKENVRTLHTALRRIQRAADEISRGVVRRRGFHPISVLLGKSQSAFWPDVEARAANDVRVNADCIRCGVCVSSCPVNNLTLVKDGIVQSGKCAVCYRCVNACPKQAITVLFHKKPAKQYQGVSEKDFYN